MNARHMTPADLTQVLDWAAAEGWNPGLDDATAFYASDPQGFFVWDIDGEAVAAISVVNHDARNAYLGLYLCKPAWRGQGIGLALWTAALAHAGPRSIGLDGVAAQQANYARSGFVLTGSTIRMQGDARPLSAPPCRRATLDDLPRLQALDAQAIGHERPAFIAGWTRNSAHRQTFTLAAPLADITAFATIRACRMGHKIGPIVAPSVEMALDLVHSSASAVGAQTLILDIPAQNQSLLSALSKAGYQETFRTARMVRGPAPVIQPSLQAIATMELG